MNSGNQPRQSQPLNQRSIQPNNGLNRFVPSQRVQSNQPSNERPSNNVANSRPLEIQSSNPRPNEQPNHSLNRPANQQLPSNGASDRRLSNGPQSNHNAQPDSNYQRLQSQMKHMQDMAFALSLQSTTKAAQVADHKKRISAANYMNANTGEEKMKCTKNFNDVLQFSRQVEATFNAFERDQNRKQNNETQMADEIRQLEMELAELPKEDELEQFVADQQEVADLQQQIDAVSKFLDENDDADTIREQIREREEEFQKNQNELEAMKLKKDQNQSANHDETAAEPDKMSSFLEKLFDVSQYVSSTGESRKARKPHKFDQLESEDSSSSQYD